MDEKSATRTVSFRARPTQSCVRDARFLRQSGLVRVAGDTAGVPIPDAERRLQTVSESVE
jgi:hypothetical protein